MRFTRSTAVAATAVAALVALGGCSSSSSGGTSGGSSGSSSEAAGGQTDIKLWLLTQGDPQKAALKTMIGEFEAANPGLTVTVEERATDDHKSQLRQVAGTDVGPDIFFNWQGPGLGGELVQNGMSLDMTKYYDQYGWKDRFTAASLAGATQYGGYHGIPWDFQGEAIYYNKVLFSQAGITGPPATYDELVADADKLVAAGITPIEFGGTDNWHVMRLLDALIETKCGAKTADMLNVTQKGWDTEPCVTEAFTDFKTWGDKYLNKGFMGMSNGDTSPLFFTGKAAMMLEGTWMDSQVVNNGMNVDDVGLFTFPTGTGRLYGFGEGLYINAASKNADAAAKFLDFATSTEQQTKTVGVWAATSVNKDVKPPEGNPLDAMWPQIFSAATGLYINNDQNFSLTRTTEYWRIHNAVLIGEIAPGDAGAQFQKFIDAN